MSPESFAILIAAEDTNLRQLIRRSLLATGFFLAEAPGAQAAFEMTKAQQFDLVLVDRNLPGGAANACRALRTQSPSLGIIVVRAEGKEGNDQAGEEDERHMLEAGADDCVVAPFRYREIVARIGAVLRRPPAAKTESRVMLRAGNIELDLKRRLIWRDGNQIHLSPREFDLLAVLMANTGAALTHTKLARSAWGDDTPHNREYLRTYVQSLRQKLESDPAHPEYILTQPWVGYRFCDPLQNKTN